MPVDARPLLAKAPVIPVLTIEDAGRAVPLARALVAGGLPVIEVTLRTPAALDAIREIAREVPEAVVGAGTILKAEDIQPATAAGSAFLVSPGTPPDLAAALSEVPVPVLPGAATVTEVMALAALGFTALKFFPAEAAGGPAFLKSLAGPLPHLVFCPTGGIGAENAPAYLALKNVGAVGGSWVVPPGSLGSGDFGTIESLARAARRLRP